MKDCAVFIIGVGYASLTLTVELETSFLLDMLASTTKIESGMSDYLDPNNEELLQDFFAEAEMQVDALESNILVLENDPGNRDAIDEIFRAAHTLKGASATVQLDALSHFTHVVEDVFDELRSSGRHVTSELTDTLLSAVDIIKGLLAARASGESYDGDTSSVEAQLASYLQSPPETKTAPRRPVRAAPPEPALPQSGTTGSSDGAGDPVSEYDLLELREAAGPDTPIVRVRVFFDETNPMNTVGGIQAFAALKQVGTVLRTTPDFDALYEDAFHPVVDYFLASDESLARVQEAVTLGDVTTRVDVTAIGAEEPATPAARTTAAPGDDSKEAASSSDVTSPQKDGEPRKAAPSSSVLRVESRRIDDLLNLVSETVINKATFNQVSADLTNAMSTLQVADETLRERLRELFDSLPGYFDQIKDGTSAKDLRRQIVDRFGDIAEAYDEFGARYRHATGKFRSTAQNLGRIAGELQEGVMRIRMVPISQIFSRFPRLVRDLTRTLNKKAQLTMEGEDTELDKSVIEDLLDPLIHCVRNSLDHGIEPPAERLRLGKPEQGQLTMKAGNEGNMILIEVSDDGRGIDVESIRERAIERSVIHPEKVLSDVEAFNLIFDAGFSTAQEVTNISGRGVGLDVVRKQIEKLNGTVAVWSEPGKGTRFTVKIPLTLAIIQGLMVRVGKEIYAIPITSVIESHRIKPTDVRTLDNYEVFNVRDDVVSLLRLNRVFRIPTDEQRENFFVVIVGSAEKRVGLIVDSLIGEEDVVIKPLRDHYTNAPGIAGANITGDGHVSLIIDVAQLLELGLRHEREQRERREAVIGGRV